MSRLGLRRFEIVKYRDDKAYREFKNKLSRVFNDADLWSCESCHWADKDDMICMQ